MAIVGFELRLAPPGDITDLLGWGRRVTEEHSNLGVDARARKRRLFTFLIGTLCLGVFALYLALAPCNQMDLVDATACQPIKAPPGPPTAYALLGKKGQVCWFETERADHKKVRLSGLLFVNDKARDIIMVSHGKGGSVAFVANDYRMQTFFRQGHSLFLYDYAGYGSSEGKATYAGLLSDGLAAYDYVVKQLHYTPSQVVLYGISMGGGVTGEIAAKRQCKAVILDSSYTSVERWAKQVVAFMKVYPSFLYPQPYYDNTAFVQAPHAPLLIVHGKKDRMIPQEHALTLNKLASSPTTLVLLQNSGHGGMAPEDYETFSRAIDSFFASLNPPTEISKT